MFTKLEQVMLSLAPTVVVLLIFFTLRAGPVDTVIAGITVWCFMWNVLGKFLIEPKAEWYEETTTSEIKRKG